MGRAAVDETVKEVIGQHRKWGLDTSEEQARREVAPLAEIADRKAAHAPPGRKLDPDADYVAEPDKTMQVRVEASPEQSWEFEQRAGYAPARVAFHQQPDPSAMRDLHESRESKLRRRLGG